jgi:4-hydroxy-tetrahydrodipicolinate synthase
MLPIQLTPFKEDGTLDEESIRRHVEYMIEGGVDGLIPLGSGGEFYSLTLEEQIEYIKVEIDQVNGRVPVLPGTSHSGTDLTIQLAKKAEDLGSDAVLVKPPYYIPLPDEGVYNHFSKIARAIEIPIMIYSSPIVSKEMVVRLADEFDNVRYIKEEPPGPRLLRVKYFREMLGDKMGYFPATFPLRSVPSILAGAVGGLYFDQQIIPKQCAIFWREAKNRRLNRMYKILEIITPLDELLWDFKTHVQIIRGWKEALVMMGIFKTSRMRNWSQPVEEVKKRKLKKILEKLNVPLN